MKLGFSRTYQFAQGVLSVAVINVCVHWSLDKVNIYLSIWPTTVLATPALRGQHLVTKYSYIFTTHSKNY